MSFHGTTLFSDVRPASTQSGASHVAVPKRLLRKVKDIDAEKYIAFNELQESRTIFEATAVIYGVYFLIMIMVSSRYMATQSPSKTNFALSLVLCILNILLLLLLILLFFMKKQSYDNTIDVRHTYKYFSRDSRGLVVFLQDAFIIGLTLTLGFWLVWRVVAGACDGRSHIGGRNFTCNPDATTNGFPSESVSGLLLLPLTFCVVVKESSFKVKSAMWLLTIAFIVTAAILVNFESNVPYLVMYIPTSFLLLYESERQNQVIFLINQKLSHLLEENERLADETYATELRHMVGNVAHDMKTPLSSFLSCMEQMSSTLAFVHSKISNSNISSDVQENLTALFEILGGLQNATTFMNMTINRSLDFTRASKGIALKPNLETAILSQLIELPIKVTSDMQNKIGISVSPLSEGICSHIVTDAQWLQENLLCLLTNAVKYTTQGNVVLEISCHDDVEYKFSELPYVENWGMLDSDEGGVSLGGVGKEPSIDFNISNRELSQQLTMRSIGNHDVVNCVGKSSRSAFPGVLFSKIEGGVIFVSRSILSENGCHSFLRFEIIDNGIGIQEDAMPKMFQPFRQAQRLNGGVGLGLYSLAKRISALGGYYGVAKRIDGENGCRFFFGIPYLPDRLSAEIRPKPVIRHASNFTSSAIVPSLLVMGDDIGRSTSYDVQSAFRDFETILLVKMHVLVVDDSLAISKMISMILRKQGHLVETASNGAEALDKVDVALFKNHPFDLILMDIQMPIMDGLEAIQRIRKNDQHGANKVQIIAMSANTDQQSAEDALAVGADKFMPKPFTMKALYEVLGNTTLNCMSSEEVDHRNGL